MVKNMKKEKSVETWSAFYCLEQLASLLGRIHNGGEDRMRTKATVGQIIEMLREFSTGLEVSPAQWPEKLAELSSNFHTYIRKCEDSALTSLIYRMVSTYSSFPAWKAFIAQLSKGADAETCTAAARKASVGDLEMALVLEAWRDAGLDASIESFREWSKPRS